MLTHLSLKNFVLIDALDLEVHDGLCVITGETGAGKSILLSALGLVSGARVQPGLIGAHGDRAEVSAAFYLPTHHPCQEILRHHDLFAEAGELILRRIINSDGRTKAFINGQNVPVGLLHDMGAQLIEIQGQFDQLAVLRPSQHRGLMDAALGLKTDLSTLATLFEAREAAAKALSAEETRLAQLAEDQDYLQHCLQELDKADLKPGEAEALSQRRQALRSLSAGAEALAQLDKLLGGDKGLIDQLARATKLASRLPGNLAGELAGMISDLDQAWNAGESAAAHLSIKLQDLAGAEQDLEETSERLFFLRDLARKHECQPEDLGQKHEEIRQALETLDQGQAHLQTLRADLQARRSAYFDAAQALSLARKAGAERLATAINAELPALKLPEARLTFQIEGTADVDAGPKGYDQVRLMAQTNRGSMPGPLEKTASGGELSRILLALKLALAPENDQAQIGPLLVFDEADAGVGGATAAALGNRLRRLSASTQVLAVTHSPQMAAAGTWHLKVRKQSQGENTNTHIDTLGEDERTQEIARMLAGTEVGQQAQEAAVALRQEFATLGQTPHGQGPWDEA